MSRPGPRVERPYRGLYAGISEVAMCAGVTRQYASYDLRPYLPTPLGFLMPNEKRPYWFLKDVMAALRRRGRILTMPTLDGAPIEEWEYAYRGPIVGVTGFADLARIPSGNVHTLTIAWGEPTPADNLRMGSLWREDDVRDVLAAHEYPRKAA